MDYRKTAQDILDHVGGRSVGVRTLHLQHIVQRDGVLSLQIIRK